MTVAIEERKTQKWVPKKWKPIHTEVVALHTVGFKNVEIASKLDKTEVWVSLVLNTPQAKILLREVFNQLEEKLATTIEQNLSTAAFKAAERIRQFISNDEMALSHPLAMFDRSIKVLSSVGKIRNAEESQKSFVNKGNMFVMSDEAAKVIAESIQLSNTVDRLHLSPLKEIPVQAVKLAASDR
jgi:hypothetical protein